MATTRERCRRRLELGLSPRWLAAAALLVVSAASGRALGQQGPDEADDGDSSSGANIAKGIVGGAMIGAQVVMLSESAFRLRPGWLYLAGGAGGGLLGGYVGYHLGNDGSNKPPALLLAGGIALLIPTIMGVLTATEYAPPGPLREPPSDDDAVGDEEGDEAGAPVLLDLPNVGLAQAFSRDELARFRVRQATELHVSLVRGAF